jgi:hypothetical protein
MKHGINVGIETGNATVPGNRPSGNHGVWQMNVRTPRRSGGLPDRSCDSVLVGPASREAMDSGGQEVCRLNDFPSLP